MIELAILLAVAGFILHSSFLLKHSKAGVDCWYHFQAVRKLRSNSWLPFRKLDSYIYEGPYDYPPVYHYIIALIPESKRVSLTRFISPAVNMAQGLILYFIGRAVFGNELAGLIAQAAFLTAPLVSYEAFAMTPRAIGSLFLFLSFYFLYAGSLLLAVVFGALVLLTHKMAAQSLLFIAIGGALFYGSPGVVLLLLASLIVALVASGGFYRVVLGSHYAVLAFWQKNIGVRWKETGLKRLARNICKIGLSPLMLAPLVLFAVYGDKSYYTIYSLLLLFYAFLTSFDQLAFLGENTKYLLFSSPFAALSLAQLLIANSTLAVPALAVLAFVSIVETTYLFRILEKVGDVVVDKQLKAAFRFIDSRKEGRVLCIPPSLSFAGGFFTRKKFLWADSCYAYEKMREVYPVPLKPWKRIAADNGIGLVLAEKSRAKNLRGKVIFENARFKVFSKLL